MFNVLKTLLTKVRFAIILNWSRACSVHSILKEHATQKVKIAQTIKQCSLNHIPYFVIFYEMIYAVLRIISEPP